MTNQAYSHVGIFRGLWASRFVDSVIVTRGTDRGTLNPATLKYEGGTAAEIYNGGALIRPNTDGSSVQYGAEEVIVFDFHIFVPATVGGILPDDTITVTVAADTDLSGRTMRCLGIDGDSYETRREIFGQLNRGGGASAD